MKEGPERREFRKRTVHLMMKNERKMRKRQKSMNKRFVLQQKVNRGLTKEKRIKNSTYIVNVIK